ncbi:potassium-transporting ATPase subunit F [Pseudomonas oryzihabitans]|uniref:K+-transporting ATPase KdpF subunit n=1 Tax=Pseudomonas oryzihabitans TaxID=47885 RepID=A0AAJ2BM95_9PSED|nr:potassium-transporting ATPase subunit F [Pseudomonas psychrotolerans]MDR6236658.1 K+-transporting ATPase KdpF subunit [Pseudomonas psychrotolerans]MDR6353940.1 K+-transporting ATPase KdpF subunit [Pseudomonas psychrotolerans]MDR6676344.1 K+-transporting ATPase KdpF subunit [Pseudomonas psychrotolerans]
MNPWNLLALLLALGLFVYLLAALLRAGRS